MGDFSDVDREINLIKNCTVNDGLVTNVVFLGVFVDIIYVMHMAVVELNVVSDYIDLRVDYEVLGGNVHYSLASLQPKGNTRVEQKENDEVQRMLILISHRCMV